jgi:hypothetical protein
MRAALSTSLWINLIDKLNLCLLGEMWLVYALKSVQESALYFNEHLPVSI